MIDMAPKDKPAPARTAAKTGGRVAKGPAKTAAGVPAKTPVKAPEKDAEKGERIAKVLSRRGVSSRREAERLIEAGEVTVNGKVITSPALNVTAKDRITISGHALPEEEPARLWLYYKPEGLVTSASDEKGRDTVFDHLPEDMPRVMSVGRLDLNSEGLLLLTNDGELKRRLELPSTGWLRKYRVRVNGNPTDAQLDPLRKGITVEGERFQPMSVTLDRIQGANAWLTVGLREGKNREIRRAMNAVELYVNRLIRTSYGPFRLGDLQPGEVEEIRPKVLRDQLGEDPVEAGATVLKRAPRPAAKSAQKPAAKPEAARKPAPRAAAGDKITLPRNARPGDGVKALARAWKEAVTPDRDDAKPARRGAAKPASRSGETGAKPAAKPRVRTASASRAKPPARPKPKRGE
jgi:23S rRNA pseudouridine2605 synthase